MYTSRMRHQGHQYQITDGEFCRGRGSLLTLLPMVSTITPSTCNRLKARITYFGAEPLVCHRRRLHTGTNNSESSRGAKLQFLGKLWFFCV